MSQNNNAAKKSPAMQRPPDDGRIFLNSAGASNPTSNIKKDIDKEKRHQHDSKPLQNKSERQKSERRNVFFFKQEKNTQQKKQQHKNIKPGKGKIQKRRQEKKPGKQRWTPEDTQYAVKNTQSQNQTNAH